MRFMFLLKSDRHAEAGVAPSEKVITAMGAYNEALTKAGALLSAEGLLPSAKGFRVRHSGGKVTVTDGPFPDAKELIAGFWIVETKSKEEAVEWAKRVPLEAAEPASTSGEIEIRQLFETPDFPVNENESGWREREDALREELRAKKAELIRADRTRYVLLFKASRDSEAGVMPTEPVLTEMGALMDEMGRSGVLLDGEGLQPSSKSAKLRYSGGKRTVTDGPFTEAKELIAGFCVIQVESSNEAVAWAKRAVQIGGDGEIEVRQVFGEKDFAELVAR